MQSVKVQKLHTRPRAALSFPGDKSLSHRAILFGALSEGSSSFRNILAGEDCVCTRKAFEAMGVDIQSSSPTEWTIIGRGLRGLRAPQSDLYLGNSGTSMRLLLGVLAGQPFQATLTGDASLSSRPMRRVTEFLRLMGAGVDGKDGGNYAPLTVHGGALKGIDVKLPVASAQLKSALLLAGLYADGRTRVTEPEKSRDHTERFLKFFGAQIEEKGLSVSITGGQRLSARSFGIAGDISSAAFFMALAALGRAPELRFRSVLWNPTRTGVVDALKRMGATVKVDRLSEEGPEPVADFRLEAGDLKSFQVKREELPALIDEVPILCVLATQAEGTTIFHEADELRVKETDRIRSMTEMLSLMGAQIRAEGNTLMVSGPTPLKGARVQSFKDHRTAMSLVIAGLFAEGETVVEDVECINTSFPDFFSLLSDCGAPVERL